MMINVYISTLGLYLCPLFCLIGPSEWSCKEKIEIKLMGEVVELRSFSGDSADISRSGANKGYSSLYAVPLRVYVDVRFRHQPSTSRRLASDYRIQKWKCIPRFLPYSMFWNWNAWPCAACCLQSPWVVSKFL
jgi:hypothetical protein